MEQLEFLDSLSLREKKKYSDMPETWKLKPLCCLSDVSEEEVYYAVSEGDKGSDWAVLRHPPLAFELYLLNKKGEQTFYFKKHAGLFSDKLEIFNASEDRLGSVQKQRSPKTKIQFQTMDAGGRALYGIEGRLEDLETFHILQGAVTVGKISKRPTPIVDEGISRKDHFGIVFPLAADTTEKGVLLGALFLIDLMF
ncbi:MAG: phospholipid scramblase-related protein [Candidatus Omnitrophota bacterium]